MVVASRDEARVARCRHSWECHLKTVYELEEVMRRMGRQAQGSENPRGIPEARDEHIRSYVIYRGISTHDNDYAKPDAPVAHSLNLFASEFLRART